MNTEVEMVLSPDIRVITAEINTYKRIAGEAIFEIGRRLKHVKELKMADSHGGWTNWLRDVDVEPSQARRFIAVVDEIGDDYRGTYHALGLRALYEIATLPPEERERPHTIPSSGVVKTVDEMTVRELREVKAALKAEKQAREQAEQLAEQERLRAEKAEADYEVVRETIESLTESERSLRREVDLTRTRPDGTDGVYRIDGKTEINGTSLSFSSDTRDFVKKYAFLRHYEAEFQSANPASSAEYNSALESLRSFVNDIQRVLSFSQSKDGIIIDM